MTLNEQERLLNDLAQDLIVLDGRVYLAQQVFSGRVREENHLAEMQSCVRQMIQALQLLHQFDKTDNSPVAPLP